MATLSPKTVHVATPVHQAMKALALRRNTTLRAETDAALRVYLEINRQPLLPVDHHPGQRTLMEVFQEEDERLKAEAEAEAAS